MLVKKDPSFFKSYLEDSSNTKGGFAEEVIIPESAEEISEALRNAHDKKTPVTISGAGTGQSGGRIPFGGVILSTEKLNRIKYTGTKDGSPCAVVESGVLIMDLKGAAWDAGLFYTYNPTEETAFVGGTIATNASGARSFRYGPTRRYVRALKIILADGNMLSIRRGDIKAKGRSVTFGTEGGTYNIKFPTYTMPSTKNSAGYYAEDNMDLIDLFIGQEGTLGVIVEAELALLKRPAGFLSFFVFFPDEKEAWNFAEEAKKAYPLSIEYFDLNCLFLLRDKYANVPPNAGSALFFEDEITENENAVLEKWEKILEGFGIPLDDTWVAMNEKSHREFLEKRHCIPESMSEMAKRSGYSKVSTDLAVPAGKLSEMLEFYRVRLKSSPLRYFVFGHIGDAHLHVNMIPKNEKGYAAAKKLQLEFVKKAITLGGTVSAEHGIGKTKKEFLKLLYGEKGAHEMFEVKKTLDPRLILGKGNIFDCE